MLRPLQNLLLRLRQHKPILLEGAEGWSFLCLPAVEQPEWGEDLAFLEGLERRPSDLPFNGGWVGFMSYDFGLELMGLSSRHEPRLPKQWWRYCDRGVACSPAGELSVFGDLDLPEVTPVDLPAFRLSGLRSSLTREAYDAALAKIHRWLRDGETYQVNFAQELLADFENDPFALYVALFAANPSAMGFYAEDEDWAVVSNSPERLFSLRGDELLAEPIKGTVAASEDPKQLLRDEKSYAELTMIVDLLRNDLGRVARPGSVEVLEHQALMRLANVTHTYSRIRARLAQGKTVVDVIRSLFPGGSVTGCPKYRTVQFIDELESFSRGAYCGSAGYVAHNGNADFNIMIRTATVKQGRLSFPAGGGIVMDSVAQAEYEETLHKAGVLRALSVT